MRMLVVSHVLPFPGKSGQQRRVAYKLRAFREYFNVTFLTTVPAPQVEATREELAAYCHEAIVLPSQYTGPVQQMRSVWFAMRTGLKRSNYAIGHVDLTAERLHAALNGHRFDVAVYEYWHAVNSVRALHRKGVPAVLDMHNILWQSYRRQLADRAVPDGVARRRVQRYRAAEEQAWKRFDALIAINRAEERIVQQMLPSKPVYYAPMGVDMGRWVYGWQPAAPPRVAYYGGLGAAHNQRSAHHTYERIMPLIWQDRPETELWIVGSGPPADIRALADADPRVRVTGFVDDVQRVLATMSVVLCPWEGTYGFRSRLIEVMAVGVPVVASPDAVYGMGMHAGRGIFLPEDDAGMAQAALDLLRDPDFARAQSQAARAQVVDSFSYEATYIKLARDLAGDFAA
ncbi:MAG: glycosyltransferase [Chloroflexi bacterium]|nr:glycosyltransferase [Chloroflexota bacterium]